MLDCFPRSGKEWKGKKRRYTYRDEGAGVVDGGFLPYLVHYLRFGIAGVGGVERHGGEAEVLRERGWRVSSRRDALLCKHLWLFCRTCCTDVGFVDVYIEFEFSVMIGLQV